MSEGEERVPPPSNGAVPAVPGDSLASGDVRQPGFETEVLDPRDYVVPDVQTVGRAVEIRGAGAQVVAEVLAGWIDSQNRRIALLRKNGDPQSRRVIREIVHKVGLVHRVLQAWEGVLSVPQENRDFPNPGN